MDAFLRFISQIRKFGSRLFISEAPGPVFLIWCNFENGCKIADLTLVRKENYSRCAGVDYRAVLNIIRKKLRNKLPVLELVYNNNVSSLIIDGETCNQEQAATLLAGRLGIRQGFHPAKRANDPQQINDVFHCWSRQVFDGITVRKADIDTLLLNESGDDIAATIEIKRRVKRPLGYWRP